MRHPRTMNRYARVAVSVLPAILMLAAEPVYKAKVGYAPEQPVPYSHKTHLSMGLKCSNCHQPDAEGFAMSFPKETFCMGCHNSVKKDSPHIAKVAEAAKTGKPIEWARVYQQPEMVWFSHDLHVTDAKLECETCHGKLEEMAVVAKARQLDMKDCMDCHAKASAPNGCSTCHPSQ